MKKTIFMVALALAVTFSSVSCKKKSNEAPDTNVEAVENATDAIQETSEDLNEDAVETTSAMDPDIIQRVKDAVKDFPGVEVEVVDDQLVLNGEVSSKEARKIKESIDALKIENVKFNYKVK